MPAYRRVEANATVTVLGVSLGKTPIGEVACLNCGNPLEIHQPDEGFPERMLGTCAHCREWFLWDFDVETNDAVIVLLPDHDYFKRAAGGTGA
jgi:hypothetical protein